MDMGVNLKKNEDTMSTFLQTKVIIDASRGREEEKSSGKICVIFCQTKQDLKVSRAYSHDSNWSLNSLLKSVDIQKNNVVLSRWEILMFPLLTVRNEHNSGVAFIQHLMKYFGSFFSDVWAFWLAVDVRFRKCLIGWEFLGNCTE